MDGIQDYTPSMIQINSLHHDNDLPGVFSHKPPKHFLEQAKLSGTFCKATPTEDGWVVWIYANGTWVSKPIRRYGTNMSDEEYDSEDDDDTGIDFYFDENDGVLVGTFDKCDEWILEHECDGCPFHPERQRFISGKISYRDDDESDEADIDPEI